MRLEKLVIMVITLAVLQAAHAGNWPKDLRKAEVETATLRVKMPTDLKVRQDLINKLQYLGNYRMFLGDSVGALEALDEARELMAYPIRQQADDGLRLASATAEDAIAAIVRAARDHRIVILNESHHVPMHRAFAMRLARELKKLGFTYLACETFEDLQPMSKGYVARDTGFYSNDPVFANLLRDAANDGWTMVQYEPFDERPREQGEAANIFERTFARDQGARVFVLVGYGHLNERPSADEDPEQAMMAAHLAKLSGHDPLTIDQTIVMAATRKKLEHPIYEKALQHFPGDGSFVLRAAQDGYTVFGLRREGSIDMQVFHRRSAIEPTSRRPHWMQAMAGYRPVDVPAHLIPKTGSQYVYATPKGQMTDGVPADIVLLRAGRIAPKFMLPPGEYTYGILK